MSNTSLRVAVNRGAGTPDDQCGDCRFACWIGGEEGLKCGLYDHVPLSEPTPLVLMRCQACLDGEADADLAERLAAVEKRAKQEATAAAWFAEQNQIEQQKRQVAEAERDALAVQVASCRKALEWLWGEGVVVFEAMTDDNGSSLWTVDLEPVGTDDTDIFYRSLSSATGVPIKHLWPEAEAGDAR